MWRNEASERPRDTALNAVVPGKVLPVAGRVEAIGCFELLKGLCVCVCLCLFGSAGVSRFAEFNGFENRRTAKHADGAAHEF